MPNPPLAYLSTGVLDTAFDSQVYQVLLNLVPQFCLSHYCFEAYGTWNRFERRRKESAVQQRIPIHSIRAFPFMGRLSLFMDALRLRPLLCALKGESRRTIIHPRGYINGFRALRAISGHRQMFRLITDYRGVSWDELRYDPSAAWRSWVNHFRSAEAFKIERQVGLESDAITCVSHEFSKWLQVRHGIPAGKISVIPSVANTNLFRFDANLRTEVRREIGIEDKLVLVYSGSMSSWQNPIETVRLFSRIYRKHPNAFLLFLTRDTERAKEVLNSLIPADLFQTLFVPYEEVPAYLCAADLAILLRDVSITNRVAMPIKLSEYLCCGLPALVTGELGMRRNTYSARSRSSVARYGSNTGQCYRTRDRSGGANTAGISCRDPLWPGTESGATR